MSNLIEHDTKNESNSAWLETLQERGLALLKFLAISLAMYVIARLIAIPLMYGLFVSHLSSDFGLEDVYARPFAIAFTALGSAAILPILLATLFGYRAKTVFFATLGASMVFAMATYFFTSDVYFNRATGASQKCYAKTLEGFKFSSTCDFDPKLGVRFQKITPEVTKEIVFWQKNGKLSNVPSVNDGQYFDRLTGESIVWYSLHSDGSIHLSSLPGFDQATGETLKPITKEVIEKYTSAVKNPSPTEPAPTPAVKSTNVFLNKALVSDIGSAFSAGNGQYGSTESSRLAMGEIWKWYFAQKNLPAVSSSTVVIDDDYLLPVTIQVENVFEVKQYKSEATRLTLVVVSFSAGDRSGRPYAKCSLWDKDAHSMSSIFRPEIARFIQGEGKSPKSGDFVDGDLNPHETMRVMYLVFNASSTEIEPGQMNSGYVDCANEKDKVIHYSLDL